ncbi:MAG: heavy metal sensor histidine kinase [Xylophilus ampelinus]
MTAARPARAADARGTAPGRTARGLRAAAAAARARLRARGRRPYALGQRLARLFALQALVGLGIVCTVVYLATAWALATRADEELARKSDLVRLLLQREVEDAHHDFDELRTQLDAFFRVHRDLSLDLRTSDGSRAYRSPDAPDFGLRQVREAALDLPVPGMAGGGARVVLRMDQSPDDLLLQRLGWILAVVAAGGSAIIAAGGAWVLRRGLAPLRDLALQTRGLSAERLDQRLVADRPAEELRPWVDQVNQLLGRLEQAWGQLEGFNADVAHELRTPLTILIGETELVLTGDRPPEAMRETLASNLEELRRLSAIVGDMLFLSRADRGAAARRDAPCSLAAEVAAVAEYHEAAFEERGLRVAVEGDRLCAYDRGLMRRAVSNLLGNASRYARAGSTVTVRIGAPDDGATADGPAAAAPVALTVRNAGEDLPPDRLARIFDRFYRLEPARGGGDTGHHGLGLAIVAAIARMHGGRTTARSGGGTTAIGFTFAPGPAPRAAASAPPP